MGLLDDAIREHLELKRLRGADPGEVAREQREALDPFPRDEHGSPDQDLSAAEDGATDMLGETAPVGTARAETDDLAGAASTAPGAEFSDDPQQTAELDMRSVLDETPGATAGAASPAGPVVGGSIGDTPPAEHPDEDSLDWEVAPGESAVRPAAAGRNHGLAVGDEGPGGSVPEQADSTRTREPHGDAPEQERLWLEPRPPSDPDVQR
jgi:hypothetical protein